MFCVIVVISVLGPMEASAIIADRTNAKGEILGLSFINTCRAY